MFWGFGCDVFGRRWAFNLTLGITSVFGFIAAGSPNFAAIGCFAALWSFGVGGNLPVDSAIFLEFLPGSHQYLLTVLSIDWAIAQVIATLVAWPLLGNLTCQEDEACTKSKNMGWRYFVICMGGLAMIMFFIRFVCFTIYESPKYLMGKGKDEDAVRIAFLPYIQATRGASFGDGSTYVTYRNALIIAVLGVPGALLGGALVEVPRLGRRGTLALATAATGAFLYASTTAADSSSLLGWNCAYNFTSNVI
ncbi:putative membrane transporter protein [Neofusicoccum parvum UCRNP2]|uniref:Putative membrane transporter protein n=1 Tax=Botryosphaeria parva (strain UCR-NP2) TaxID=1287680 RepID=R1GW19_BOTPV|nr:putative membrane transporter protein [Neofusicoccum parvum UCRNP2]